MISDSISDGELRQVTREGGFVVKENFDYQLDEKLHRLHEGEFIIVLEKKTELTGGCDFSMIRVLTSTGLWWTFVSHIDVFTK